MEINYSDFKRKKVLNVLDGRDLGRVSDFIMTLPDGKITAIIVPGKKNGFFCQNELIINFGCIEKVGDDVILVKLCHKKECESVKSQPNKNEETYYDSEE